MNRMNTFLSEYDIIWKVMYSTIWSVKILDINLPAAICSETKLCYHVVARSLQVSGASFWIKWISIHYSRVFYVANFLHNSNCLLNPFHATDAFLYPLKTWNNQRGYRKGPVLRNTLFCIAKVCIAIIINKTVGTLFKNLATKFKVFSFKNYK